MLVAIVECQNFLQHCSLRLSVLHNNFNSLTKFLALYLAKFLDTSNHFFCIRGTIWTEVKT